MAETSFSAKMNNGYDSIVASALFCNAFVHSFELVYHFTFPVYLNYFTFPFLDGQQISYLLIEAIALLPLFLIRKHLSLKRICIAPFAVFLVLWAVWILHGYPQYFVEGYFYPRILRTADPYNLSLYLNFGSKAALAVLFATLLSIANIQESLHIKRRPATDIQS